MMKKTRGAVFSMLLSRQGLAGRFPPAARWLDLFAGTGSVGLEALSRGCSECHFVEMDGWVVRECLRPNIAEVSSTELLAALARSPLLHARSWLLVEYAKENADEIPDALGPLEICADRRFGRTFIALYGPSATDNQ